MPLKIPEKGPQCRSKSQGGHHTIHGLSLQEALNTTSNARKKALNTTRNPRKRATVPFRACQYHSGRPQYHSGPVSARGLEYHFKSQEKALNTTRNPRKRATIPFRACQCHPGGLHTIQGFPENHRPSRSAQF